MIKININKGKFAENNHWILVRCRVEYSSLTLLKEFLGEIGKELITLEISFMTLKVFYLPLLA
jgi:hypothetical protein